MKCLKLFLAAFLILCLIASASASVFAEDPEETEDTTEEEQTEEEQSVFYYEWDREVTVEDCDADGIPLTEEVKAYIADRYSEDASLIEYMIWRDYEEGTGIEWPPPGAGWEFQQDDPCEKYGHLFRYVRITAVRHCFFDTEPRCLECTYKVAYCERCSYYVENFDGPNGGIKRISCHSGTALKDWEIYDNYLHYGGAPENISGYVTDSATVYFTRNFALAHDTVSPSDFPDIADRIDSIEYSKNTRTATVRFKGAGVTKDAIDSYIAGLKYIDSLSYVGNVVPDYRTEKYEPPAPADESEAKDEETSVDHGKDGAQTEPLPEEPPVPPSAEPGSWISTPDSHAAQSEPPVPQSGAKAPLHNPPTGDELYLLIFIAALSLSTMIALIWRKKSKKNII